MTHSHQLAPAVLKNNSHHSVRQRNRITANTPNNSVKSSKTPMGASADKNPNPRQVMPSNPSIAHRVGTTTVSFLSHAGKTKVGTQAPPSITMMSVAMID
jgi:hypothetical protein